MDSIPNTEMDSNINQEMDRIVYRDGQGYKSIVNQKMARMVNQELDVGKVCNQDKTRLHVIKGFI